MTAPTVPPPAPLSPHAGAGGASFTGEVHPLADVWPMLGGDDLAALAESIAANGLREPIVASIHDDTANYPGPLDYVQALRMIEQTAQSAQRDAVLHAKACGESWETIGRMLGTTRQSAHERYTAWGVK